MAVSKSGGTRTYLRGRVANDVYSIGKDAVGKKQQVVRSLAETVANPQTASQMRGRMIMSTVMQSVSAMSQIIDHSFDNVPNGQPAISEFIRLNYALIKRDIADHPASGNAFMLNRYQQKGLLPGRYQVAAGSVIANANFIVGGGASFAINVALGGEGRTAAQVREALGLGSYAYITLCAIQYDYVNSKFVFIRLHPSATLPDDTVITADNFLQLFTIDNPLGITLTAAAGTPAGTITLSFSDGSFATFAAGFIFSQEQSGKFIHSTSILSVSTLDDGAADSVLPSYPQGSQRYLNGGEL